jgi:HK97 family phage major capsid protein
MTFHVPTQKTQRKRKTPIMNNTATAIAAATERRNKALNSMATLASKGQHDTEVYRALEKAANEEDENLAALRKLASLQTEDDRANTPKVVADAVSSAVRSTMPGVLSSFTNTGEQTREHRMQELRESFMRFIKGEHRDLISTGDTTGEALVPQEFSVLTQATKLFGPIASLVSVRHENDGHVSKHPVSNDVSNYAVLVGQGNSGAEADPTVFSAIPNTVSDSLYTKTIASIQLAHDATAGGNLEQYLTQLFGVRIGRSLEHLVTLGTDPAGNVAAASPTGGLLASLSPLTTTTAVANGLGWNDFVNAASAIDPSYLRGENSRLVHELGNHDDSRCPEGHDWSPAMDSERSRRHRFDSRNQGRTQSVGLVYRCEQHSRLAW